MTKGSRPEFNWTPLADRSFNELKKVCVYCTAPLLSLLDFSVSFTIYTDASDAGTWESLVATKRLTRVCDSLRLQDTDVSRKKLCDDGERVFGYRMDSEPLAVIFAR